MSAKRHEIEEHELVGLKYFKAISRLLERLHGAGCARDRAHNRQLHMDQFVSLLLLYMFNPICVSLRGIQQPSGPQKVQRVLGVPRASLGSLSEAARVFDSDLMLEIIGGLSAGLKPISHHAKLNDLGGILTAVDGTLLKALPKTVWALWLDDDRKALKAHVQFEVLKGVPVSAVITNANASEKVVLSQNLAPERLYVLDRGYAKYALLQEIVDMGSSFVCRIRDNACFEVIEERTLPQDAIEAGIVRDVVV